MKIRSVSLAGRLVRLAKSLGATEQAEVKERSGGLSLADMSNRLLDAIDQIKSRRVAVANPNRCGGATVGENPELRAR